jgi:hypothetical protein
MLYYFRYLSFKIVQVDELPIYEMQTCPICSRQVNKQALLCPHCSYPIQGTVEAQGNFVAHYKRLHTELSKKKEVISTATSILYVFGILSLLSGLGGSIILAIFQSVESNGAWLGLCVIAIVLFFLARWSKMNPFNAFRASVLFGVAVLLAYLAIIPQLSLFIVAGQIAIIVIIFKASEAAFKVRRLEMELLERGWRQG